jgi:uncharacterized protein YjaZ
MLIPINELGDEHAEEKLLVELQQYYDEVREILPKLPKNLQIYFDDFCMVPEFGCGGYAYSAIIMTIAYDFDFADKNLQQKSLRDTVFHESYHIAQGYHGEMGEISPIEVAVYEGAAMVFEREIAKSKAEYGSYDEQKVKDWYKILKTLPNDYDWYAWKVYDEVDQEYYKSYKTGTYIVDQAIKKSGKSILELNDLNAKEILALAELKD